MSDPTSQTDTSPQDWQPRDPAVLADQRRAYDELRERCPVAHSDAMHWSVFQHADVAAILADPDTFTNASRHHAIPNAMNGDEHARHRAILARHFTPEAMDVVAPRCREIARETVSALSRPGQAEAVADIAEPIALRTMCAFLGWPEETWSRVQAWIHGNQAATFRRDREAGRALAAEYAAIVSDALEDHRQRGIRDDVTGQLMDTKVDGHQWTDAEIIATLRNWIAGHGTVSSAIGIVIAHLAADPDLQHRLRQQPELIPAAIEEIPRADGPLVANTRTTTRAVTVGDRVIPAGERISLMWIAANRDPRAFDVPDEIQLDRDQAGNLLYGAGIHYCLGAPLARLELRVAVEALLTHTTEFSLSSPESLTRETYPSNGFAAVPLRLS